MPPVDLPITALLPDIRRLLATQTSLVLSAPPGSGKTTGVPPALLDEPWLAGGKILILEPRRLAARLAAQRLAWMLGEQVGERVGYTIRFERRVSPRTRIEVVTEGILSRRLQRDPELAGVGLVIFDEFHERSIHADLALALTLDARQALRPELRLLVMSATLDCQAMAALLGDATILTGQGRSFPVEIRHAPDAGVFAGGYDFYRLVDLVSRTVLAALAEESGDLLAFLPGAGEIRAVAERVAGRRRDCAVLPLYGNLSRARQEAAVRPDPRGRRRVILATPIAETSLTIEGIRIVVDGGWEKQLRFVADSGLARLQPVRISRASATQRSGRAGRLAPGVCYRLWDRVTEQGMQEHRRPEMLTADLAPLALELAQWGTSVDHLSWLDPPPAKPYGQAVDLLRTLGALAADNTITPIGRQMVELPLHPRLARMVIAGRQQGDGDRACQLAALLSERDLAAGRRGVDLELRLHSLERGELAEPVMRRLQQTCRRLRAQGDAMGGQHYSVGAHLAWAYPDRIGRLRSGSRHRYLLAGGRGARLPAQDPLCGTPWLVAAELDAGQVEGRIFLAAAISEAELNQIHHRLLGWQQAVEWDRQGQRVRAWRRQMLGEVIVAEEVCKKVDPDLQRRVLLDGIRAAGGAALPWNESARALQARVLFLHREDPDSDWPDYSDTNLLATLESWLGPYVDGMRSLQQVAKLDLGRLLRQQLPWQLRHRLAELAPTHLVVPSGRRHRLHYPAEGPPVLAVRLQELFGLAGNPTVLGGRIPVCLHLLSPAMRPVQVTTDLASFWNTTYRQVKKELQGRYPKHHWPDDPWTAAATAGVRKKRRR